jgi:hypothetical protein
MFETAGSYGTGGFCKEAEEKKTRTAVRVFCMDYSMEMI